MSYYTVLGVNRDFTDAELRKAYRNLCLECHPDRNPDNPQAEERFKRVSVAYQVLSDPQKRRDYDLSQTFGGGIPGAGGFTFDGDPQANIKSMIDMFSDFLDNSPLFEAQREEAARQERARKKRAKPKSKPKRRAKKAAPKKTPPKCSTCLDLGHRIARQGTFSFKVPCPACG